MEPIRFGAKDFTNIAAEKLQSIRLTKPSSLHPYTLKEQKPNAKRDFKWRYITIFSSQMGEKSSRRATLPKKIRTIPRTQLQLHRVIKIWRIQNTIRVPNLSSTSWINRIRINHWRWLITEPILLLNWFPRFLLHRCFSRSRIKVSITGRHKPRQNNLYLRAWRSNEPIILTAPTAIVARMKTFSSINDTRKQRSRSRAITHKTTRVIVLLLRMMVVRRIAIHKIRVFLHFVVG